ncbi:MAG TPA: hypothetical protein VK480_04865 [Solirubrobacterales bacterium]|nr:hypothetical protein [Solirubrobacterales bacterium]
MEKPRKGIKNLLKDHWKTILTAIFVAIALVVGIFIGKGLMDEGDFRPSVPPNGAAEFLYLDAARVATYLAQVDGGESESEKLTRKLTANLNAKLSVKELGEVGASKASELFTERTLKPTAASSFFALEKRLDEADVIKKIRLRLFNQRIKQMPEGRFVEFQTSGLLSPNYLNGYLAVSHAGTLDAIFPNSKERQEGAKKFFESVGATPRAVFALRPYEKNASGALPPGLPREEFVYLLPIATPLLSSERSLLKYGGGRFTVLGKLVRRFPEPTNHHFPAYIDSATREVWEQAVKRTPKELLCRTAPRCAELVRRRKLSGAARNRVIRKSRTQILERLRIQTEIPRQGAVILPLAIYK